jgi:hypothetical protein
MMIDLSKAPPPSRHHIIQMRYCPFFDIFSLVFVCQSVQMNWIDECHLCIGSVRVSFQGVEEFEHALHIDGIVIVQLDRVLRCFLKYDALA